jgi:predicted dehydrogenase
MERVINTALTSFGMSGQVFHGPCLKVNRTFRINRILERTKNLSAEKYSEARIARSYKEILSDPDIELVVVNTPDAFHYEMAKAALLAGKHVVVEKPFAQTLEEAKELIRLAKDTKRMLTVYQNRRWDGDFLTVKKLIEDGVLGRLVEFESHYDRYRNFIQEGTWKEEAGDKTGVLYNLGPHMIDQALVLFGNPLSVTAHLQTLRTGGKVTDYYDIRLQYSGFAVLLKCSYLVREPGPRYSVHGTLGSFHKWGIDPQEEALKAGQLPVSKGWGTEPESDWGILHSEKDGQSFRQEIETIPGNYSIFYEKVYDAIVHQKEPPVKPEEALLTQEILELCELSNREKRTVFL